MPSQFPGKIRTFAKNRLKSILDGYGYSIVNNNYNYTAASRLDFILKQLFSGGSQSPLLFDVGANIGKSTIHFKSLFPDSKVYCFEAVPDTYLILASNLNRLTDVTLYNLALGATEETRRIFLREDNQWNSLIPEINQYLQGQNCPSVEVSISTIDKIMADNSIKVIDLLKIDTEGYETEVLRGARSAFEMGGVRSVLLEVGFDKSQLQHSFYLDIFGQLDELGFRFQGIYEPSYDKNNSIDFANAFFYRGNSLG